MTPHQTTGNSPCTSPSTLPLPWRVGCLLYCQRVAGSKVKRWLRGAPGGDTITVTLEAIWNSQLRSIVFIMFLQFPTNKKKKSPVPTATQISVFSTVLILPRILLWPLPQNTLWWHSHETTKEELRRVRKKELATPAVRPCQKPESIHRNQRNGRTDC